ncbi:MAG: 2-amino-4-hydroxy-6-hydroxymethyldihydropteridine diphosphokinase [Bacteroidetes bacterium]|nr:2-amino-4-hydroxy-6-hydroxymethyldihydropteridine diphosphokinase [Bacteroidota bacterium]
MSSSSASEETEAYLLLGSNIGDRIGYLKKSVSSISALSRSRRVELSAVYESEPVGYTDQPKFLNLAAVISTPINAHELLFRLKDIERTMGRIPRERWREREIDIDIIFYGGSQINTDDLTVPHPRAHLRRFVLLPLYEIAPGFIHPSFNKTVKQLLDECEDRSEVARFETLSVLQK